LPDSPRPVSAAAQQRSARARRGRLRTILQATLALLLAAVLGFSVYASMPMTAEASPLQVVRTNPAITLVDTADGVVLSPAGSATANGAGAAAANGSVHPRTGLVFFAGARVDPAAYAAKLSGLAEAGVTVVIARPVFGFAILEWRSIDTFTDLAPGVDTWFVGGHSLGGVRACQYLADDEVSASNTSETNGGQVDFAVLHGLVLVGSYCAADVSNSDLPALSIAGSHDGLSTPQKIEDAAALLATSTEFVEIAGANHASFGDYGVQPGDGTATADDAEVTDAITAAVLDFMG
jgi:pimeloyl-ACP methyl ester carboxylesterase